MADTKPKPADKEPAKRDPLVLTVSEHNALSEADQSKFRKAHGTVTSDPAE